MIRISIFALLILAACGGAPKGENTSNDTSPDEIQSGFEFLTPETQALQTDAFANPGYLWVDRGDALFKTIEGVSQACVSCHQNGLPGIAATFPKVSASTGALLNLEGQINSCRTSHQDAPPFAYESQALLSLTAFVANQSSGVPLNVETSGQAADYVEQGRNYFYTRRGQFNLSCAQCHNESWGRKLRGDTISQGHGNGFPAYRLEWQKLGSLQRRLHDCDTGVRAQPLPYGSETYIAVELYLAARAAGLPMESPAVRR